MLRLFTCLARSLGRTYASICSHAIGGFRKLFSSMIHCLGVLFTEIEALTIFVIITQKIPSIKKKTNVSFCEIINRQMGVFTL